MYLKNPNNILIESIIHKTLFTDFKYVIYNTDKDLSEDF